MSIRLLIALSLLLPAFLFLPGISNAQSEITKEDLRDMSRNVIPVTRSTETIGTPYLFDDFQTGIVTLNDGNVTEALSMNFNVHENRVEYADGQAILAFLGDEITSFEIYDGPNLMRFQKGFEARGLEKDEFVQVLSDGPAVGLLKHEVNFQQDVAMYGSATQRDEYVSNMRLYIYEDGNVERIRRLSERRITRAMDADRNELRNFISENNLDLENPYHLRQLFEFYNQIK
ncbi:MAG: hypothetical protein EA391_01380 [Balneolaceae bacterium]|nr:MAG: hypothetical protein EA391_01380 [Balneolaceae bacterium]